MSTTTLTTQVPLTEPELKLLQTLVYQECGMYFDERRTQERRDWSRRIWRAGCSTGQEPYTLAMMVCDAMAYYYLRNPLPFDMPSPKPLIPPPWKVEILASDINYSSLRAGQEGVYNENHMEQVD